MSRKRKSNQKVTTRSGELSSLCLFSNSDAGQGQSVYLPRGQTFSVTRNHVSCMCAQTQHPPVPNSACCACHSLLAHIPDRAAHTFRKHRRVSVCVSIKVSVCVSMRDEEGGGRPSRSHSSVPLLTVANAVLTSVMTPLLGHH